MVGNELDILNNRSFLLKKIGQDGIDFITSQYRMASDKAYQFDILCQLHPDLFPKEIYMILQYYGYDLPKVSNTRLNRRIYSGRIDKMKFHGKYISFKKKVTEEMELRIIEDLNSGMTQEDASIKYDVHKSKINHVARKYKDLGIYIPYKERNRGYRKPNKRKDIS